MSWTHTRSKIAHAKRRDPSADVTELAHQLRVERLEDYTTRAVAAAPPLSDATRDHLALLLRGGGGHGAP